MQSQTRQIKKALQEMLHMANEIERIEIQLEAALNSVGLSPVNHLLSTEQVKAKPLRRTVNAEGLNKHILNTPSGKAAIPLLVKLWFYSKENKTSFSKEEVHTLLGGKRSYWLWNTSKTYLRVSHVVERSQNVGDRRSYRFTKQAAEKIKQHINELIN